MLMDSIQGPLRRAVGGGIVTAEARGRILGVIYEGARVARQLVAERA